MKESLFIDGLGKVFQRHHEVKLSLKTPNRIDADGLNVDIVSEPFIKKSNLILTNLKSYLFLTYRHNIFVFRYKNRNMVSVSMVLTWM